MLLRSREARMAESEIAFLVLVVVGMAVFAITLAVVSHKTGQ
jgi:hypothetical protein